MVSIYEGTLPKHSYTQQGLRLCLVDPLRYDLPSNLNLDLNLIIIIQEASRSNLEGKKALAFNHVQYYFRPISLFRMDYLDCRPRHLKAMYQKVINSHLNRVFFIDEN